MDTVYMGVFSQNGWFIIMEHSIFWWDDLGGKKPPILGNIQASHFRILGWFLRLFSQATAFLKEDSFHGFRVHLQLRNLPTPRYLRSIQKPARHKEPENKAWCCTEAQEAQKLLTFHEAFWIHLLGQGRSNLPWLASWPQGCTSFAFSILQP